MSKSQDLISKINEAEEYNGNELLSDLKKDLDIKNLIKIAQRIYDHWDDILVEGQGLCDEIAKYFSFTINKDYKKYNARIDDKNIYHHVVTLVSYDKIDTEMIPAVYVDIDWHIYETNRGNLFYKIPNVKFKESDINFRLVTVKNKMFKSFKQWDF